jgi:hypothetical protein
MEDARFATIGIVGKDGFMNQSLAMPALFAKESREISYNLTGMCYGLSFREPT